MSKKFDDFIKYSNRKELLDARNDAVIAALSEFENDNGIISPQMFGQAILAASQDLTVEILGEYHDWLNLPDGE